MKSQWEEEPWKTMASYTRSLKENNIDLQCRQNPKMSSDLIYTVIVSKMVNIINIMNK